MASTLSLTSEAFQNGAAIPRRYTEDGENLSPPLTWSELPPEARQLVLIVDDPDAPPSEPWVHWVIYNIPVSTAGFGEGIPADEQLSNPAGALQGLNSWGSVGYRGPAPPAGHGTHHYHLKLYALESELNLKPGVKKEQLLKALEAHVVARGELVGTYER